MKRFLLFIIVLSFIFAPSAEAMTIKYDDKPIQCEIPDGAIGVWQIPYLKIVVPVYDGPRYKWQDIVDEDYSALLSNWGTARMIGDHALSDSVNNIGWWDIESVRLGMQAFFVKNDGIYEYLCCLTAVVDVQPWGYTINGKTLSPYSSTDILNVCCFGNDSTRNFVALFKYIGGYDSVH